MSGRSPQATARSIFLEGGSLYRFLMRLLLRLQQQPSRIII
jgi:hypothetical protein